ncbi:hypothetical protein [Stieleria varia]|uniref:Uncharacterized protein n=1 Tax=Stieleria varia TaxID=2528005 RepID=A0A5C5ZTD2_9BACT|nr:hypothetical protein [Stieleria varia]TWT89463.1 hypothetical protein Pla52n_68020 [Stieleria varia]
MPVAASFDTQGPTTFSGLQTAWSHRITAERDAYLAIHDMSATPLQRVNPVFFMV